MRGATCIPSHREDNIGYISHGACREMSPESLGDMQILQTRGREGVLGVTRRKCDQLSLFFVSCLHVYGEGASRIPLLRCVLYVSLGIINQGIHNLSHVFLQPALAKFLLI